LPSINLQPEIDLTIINTEYRVQSLPEVDFDIGEMYSGLIPIDAKNMSRALFFVFQPTIGPPVDEITIWMNGGPGCTSMMGFFQENGRFTWIPGTFKPVENPYTWVNLTNMLWLGLSPPHHSAAVSIDSQ
jgi:carboxypeptidase D